MDVGACARTGRRMDYVKTEVEVTGWRRNVWSDVRVSSSDRSGQLFGDELSRCRRLLPSLHWRWESFQWLRSPVHACSLIFVLALV